MQRSCTSHRAAVAGAFPFKRACKGVAIVSDAQPYTHTRARTHTHPHTCTDSAYRRGSVPRVGSSTRSHRRCRRHRWTQTTNSASRGDALQQLASVAAEGAAATPTMEVWKQHSASTTGPGHQTMEHHQQGPMKQDQQRRCFRHCHRRVQNRRRRRCRYHRRRPVGCGGVAELRQADHCRTQRQQLRLQRRIPRSRWSRSSPAGCVGAVPPAQAKQ